MSWAVVTVVPLIVLEAVSSDRLVVASFGVVFLKD